MSQNQQDTTRPEPAYDLVVFDIAGTTVDEGSAVYTAMRDALGEVGVEVSDADLDVNKGTDKRTALATLMRLAGREAGDSEVDAVYSRFGELLDQAYRDNPPVAVPGAIECLAELRRRGVHTALTTGFTRRVAADVLRAAGVEVGPDGVVEVLVTTEDVPAARPAPYMIHHAMEATGVRDVRRVLSAGDTVADVRSHRNAGVCSVSVLTGDTTEETLRAEGPDHLLPSVAGVPDLVGGA